MSTSDDRTEKQKDRYDYMLSLTAWGLLSDETHIGIICIEDGGPEWLWRKADKCAREWLEARDATSDLNRAVEDLDNDIKDVKGSNPTINGFRCVRIRPGKPSKPGSSTERNQMHTAWRLRQTIDAPSAGAAKSYDQKLMRGFEVIGNLYPFAKPRADTDLSPRTKDYLGYHRNTTLKEIHDDVLPKRLDGIANLASILGAKENGLLIFAGISRPQKNQIINRLLSTQEPPQADAGTEHQAIEGYASQRSIQCWKKRSGKAPVFCFVDDMTFRFTPKVCDRLVVLLKEVGWPV